MRGIIYIYVIYQLLYFTSNVESLKGTKVIKAEQDESLFIASFQHIDGEHFCTGSLITIRHILTAAHCLEDEQPDEVRIVLGISDLRNANVRYKLAPWHTYNSWAINLGIPVGAGQHDLAIVPLLDDINEVNIKPVRLSELNKKQVQGKSAIILGWSNTIILEKAVVNVLRDDECARKMHLITNEVENAGPEILCTSAQPHVLMNSGDSGGPLLDKYGGLLGVNAGDCPDRKHCWGNFSKEFLQTHQVNIHFSVDHPYYRRFIIDVTSYQ